MIRQKYPSALLEEATDQIGALPGIGRRTALRLAMHLLRQPADNVRRLASSIVHLREDVRYCPVCGMISDSGLCSICADTSRDPGTVCVVESLRDVLSIESAGQYRGVYHVLGGIISPIDGIGPSDISVKELVARVAAPEPKVKEVILALSTDVEGETTAFYIYRQLSGYDVRITAIARGVGFGDDLEYTDEMTLVRSIEDRREFKP